MEKKNRERITKLIWYFTIFSIIGLVVETVYCFITCNGTIESRKGLLIGPFCPVYGIGAVVIIEALNGFQKKPIKLFLLGTILGTVIEYTLSYGLEAIYGSRFWDYSYMNLNINGRICLIYSVFWGVLSIILIDYIKPVVDHFINKIKPEISKKIEKILIIFFIIDAIVTLISISTYTQIAKDKYLEMEETKEIVQKQKTEIQDTEQGEQQGETQEQQEEEQVEEQEQEDINLFYNKIMPALFPNIRIKGKSGEGIWARDIMKIE